MTRSLFRFGLLDALLVGLAAVHAGCVGALWLLPTEAPFLLLGAVGFAVILWWNANTISHNHMHSPLFRLRWLNHLFSLFLTVTTLVPQTLWKRRHLWHHAGEPAGTSARLPLGLFGVVELGLIVALAAGCLWLSPVRFGLCFLPGFGLGMLLCQLQGHYEHAGQSVTVEPGVSYYGRLYNWLWFNDGYHAEHHRHPACHWSMLPTRKLLRPAPTTSQWPPILRALESLQVRVRCNRWQARALVLLEKLALGPGPIQRWMLSTHERALAQMVQTPWLAAYLRQKPSVQIGVVGGGLFPRTALLLAKLLPAATLRIIDENPAHVQLGKDVLVQQGVSLQRLMFCCERFAAARHTDCDLLVFPLGYVGDRDQLYRVPAGEPPRLIHDWLFRPRGHDGVTISWLLCKRLNLAVATPSVAHSEPLRKAS